MTLDLGRGGYRVAVAARRLKQGENRLFDNVAPLACLSDGLSDLLDHCALPLIDGLSFGSGSRVSRSSEPARSLHAYTA